MKLTFKLNCEICFFNFLKTLKVNYYNFIKSTYLLFAGKIFVLFVVLDVILLKILDYYQPFNSREKKLKKLKIK